MSTKLTRDSRYRSLLISLAEDLAHHTVEETEPIQGRYSKRYYLSLPINGLGKVRLIYKTRYAEDRIQGYEQFEVSVANRRVLFLRGETLKKANVFDANELDSRMKLMLERYVQQNLD